MAVDKIFRIVLTLGMVGGLNLGTTWAEEVTRIPSQYIVKSLTQDTRDDHKTGAIRVELTKNQQLWAQSSTSGSPMQVDARGFREDFSDTSYRFFEIFQMNGHTYALATDGSNTSSEEFVHYIWLGDAPSPGDGNVFEAGIPPATAAVFSGIALSAYMAGAFEQGHNIAPWFFSIGVCMAAREAYRTLKMLTNPSTPAEECPQIFSPYSTALTANDYRYRVKEIERTVTGEISDVIVQQKSEGGFSNRQLSELEAERFEKLRCAHALMSPH